MNTKNSSTFLDIFNQVDEYLDKRIDSKKRFGFYEKLNLIAEKDPVINKYQRDLLQFNSLRNVIVHRYRANSVIAEPNDETVRLFIEIKKQILNPIKIKDTPFIHEVFSVDPKDTIGKVIATMAKNFYSQVPVYSNGQLVDFLSNNTIALWLAANVDAELVDIKNTEVGEVLKHMEFRNNYILASQNAILMKVADKFESYRQQGKYLDAVLVTQSGKKDEKALGIISVEDLPEIHKLLALA